MVHSVAAFGGHVWASHDHKLYKFGPNLEKEAESDLDLSLLTVASDGAYIVGLASESKRVLVVDSSDITSIKAEHEFPKRPSGISVCGSDLVVSDKFGDVFHRTLTESSAVNSSEPILGHVSMVLDVAFASPEFVVTSDRDEHIRISRFPKSYVIERFLFGHESFVSHIFVSNDILVSAGGDPYVLAWNWRTGEQLAKLDVGGNVIALAGNESFVYIAVEGSSTVTKAELPGLSVVETLKLADAVQALACTADHCYAALPSELVLLGGSTYTFDTKDSELNSEQHLMKRAQDHSEEK